jgi:hypothetical protein
MQYASFQERELDQIRRKQKNCGLFHIIFSYTTLVNEFLFPYRKEKSSQINGYTLLFLFSFAHFRAFSQVVLSSNFPPSEGRLIHPVHLIISCSLTAKNGSRIEVSR